MRKSAHSRMIQITRVIAACSADHAILCAFDEDENFAAVVVMAKKHSERKWDADAFRDARVT